MNKNNIIFFLKIANIDSENKTGNEKRYII